MKIHDAQHGYITARPGDYPPLELPECAFLGRSNVGKSSLINSLVGRRKLARTSKAPGRTRAVHWYNIARSSHSCCFVDLPGYGYAKVSRRIREEEWAKLIEGYLQSGRPRLAVQLLDIRLDKPTVLDLQMIEWLRANNLPTVFVLTKADKLARGRRAAAKQRFSRLLEIGREDAATRSVVVAYSAITGDGKADLWSEIDRTACQPTNDAARIATSKQSDTQTREVADAN